MNLTEWCRCCDDLGKKIKAIATVRYGVNEEEAEEIPVCDLHIEAIMEADYPFASVI